MIARCNRFSRSKTPLLAGGEALGEGDEKVLDGGVDNGRSRLAGDGNGLDRGPGGDLLEEILFVGVEHSVRAQRGGQRIHDLGVEHRSAGRHLPDRSGELVAFADPVLEHVGVPGGAFGEQETRRIPGRRIGTG